MSIAVPLVDAPRLVDEARAAQLPPIPVDLDGWQWQLRPGGEVRLYLETDGLVTQWRIDSGTESIAEARAIIAQEASITKVFASSRSILRDLAPGAIRRDGGTQARVGNNEETVEEYATAMREGRWQWTAQNAVVVFLDDASYWLADGFHRIEAAQRASLATVLADVRQGTRRDAVLHAAGANASHGLRRTRADVRKSIELLLRDEEWGKWSDREIARRVGCHNETVGAVRKELESTDGIRQLDARKGADGKTRQLPTAPTKQTQPDTDALPPTPPDPIQEIRIELEALANRQQAGMFNADDQAALNNLGSRLTHLSATLDDATYESLARMAGSLYAWQPLEPEPEPEPEPEKTTPSATFTADEIADKARTCLLRLDTHTAAPFVESLSGSAKKVWRSDLEQTHRIALALYSGKHNQAKAEARKISDSELHAALIAHIDANEAQWIELQERAEALGFDVVYVGEEEIQLTQDGITERTHNDLVSFEALIVKLGAARVAPEPDTSTAPDPLPIFSDNEAEVRALIAVLGGTYVKDEGHGWYRVQWPDDTTSVHNLNALRARVNAAQSSVPQADVAPDRLSSLRQRVELLGYTLRQDSQNISVMDGSVMLIGVGADCLDSLETQINRLEQQTISDRQPLKHELDNAAAEDAQLSDGELAAAAPPVVDEPPIIDLSARLLGAVECIIRGFPEPTLRLLAGALCFDDVALVAFSAPTETLVDGLMEVARIGSLDNCPDAAQTVLRRWEAL